MWGLTLVAALVLVMVLERVTRGAPLDARATLALGGLLLVAHIGGVLARRLGGPRVAGFLLAGVLAGPAWVGAVRAGDLAALRLIADGALALIALAVGLELRATALRPRDAATVLLPFLSVTFVALTVVPWFPLTRHQPFGDGLAVALLLGAVAAVSSPTLAHAVLTERDRPPDRARAVVTVSAAQVLVVALLVPLVLVVMRPISSPGALLPGMATAALTQLGGAVLFGLALGSLVVCYLTMLRGPLPALFVLLGAALLTGQATRWLGLDVTLAALAAGGAVAIVGPPVERERLREALRATAAPVHLVFFAWAGSSLRFEALRDLWPWVLLFAGLRLVSLRAAWAWSTHAPAVASAPQAWLGLVPQGAFAVAVAGLARQAFPEWGISLEALILAMIGVHALAGPVAFHAALRTMEREEQHGTDSSETDGAVFVAAKSGSGGGGPGAGVWG